MIQINFADEKPIYSQIYEQLILSIASGELKPGDSLPSVRMMAEEIGVNLHTVNKSYQALQSDGYVALHRRRGAVVNERNPSMLPIVSDKQICAELELVIAKCFLRGYSAEDLQRLVLERFLEMEGDSRDKHSQH